MPKTQTICPRCKQPIVAEVEQVFDLNTDPQAKQRLLNGTVNVARCNSCGYSGPIATPVVYHDPEKELLLTFFPSEMGVPVNEQEKLIGPLINKVVNALPNEKKKAYLLQPKTMLTYQTLVETILQGDGITKEMLDDQQKKLSLLQRLASATPESRLQIIKQEEPLIDQTFFALLSRILEVTMAQGDQTTAKSLADLQKQLLENTRVGQEIKVQSREVESAIKALQDATKEGLSREKLLDLFINATSDLYISTMVGMARSGMDYAFFQMLTDKIDHSQGDEQRKLLELRQKLLDLTKEVDQKIDAELKRARQALEKIVSVSDVEKTAEASLGEIDDFFVQVLRTALEDAKQRDDKDRLSKLEKLVAVIEKASAPPPEVEFIQQLISAPDDAVLQKMMEENADKFTNQFFQVLNSIVVQGESNQKEDVQKRLEHVFNAVTKFSMQSKLNQK
jgi:hypothetical protein